MLGALGEDLRLYHRLIGMQLRAQAQYKASLIIDIGTYFAVTGLEFVALLIVVSSLGFLSVVILTGPRLYYAMAVDGLFFRRAARLHPRYHTPVFALWFQAAVSLLLLTTNTYDQLLSYVVFADWLFFGLTAGALLMIGAPVSAVSNSWPLIVLPSTFAGRKKAKATSFCPLSKNERAKVPALLSWL